MELLPEPTRPSWPFPFTSQDWEQTPTAVQAYLHTMRAALDQLQDRVETLEALLKQNSTTSHRPPSHGSWRARESRSSRDAWPEPRRRPHSPK